MDPPAHHERDELTSPWTRIQQVLPPFGCAILAMFVGFSMLNRNQHSARDALLGVSVAAAILLLLFGLLKWLASRQPRALENPDTFPDFPEIPPVPNQTSPLQPLLGAILLLSALVIGFVIALMYFGTQFSPTSGSAVTTNTPQAIPENDVLRNIDEFLKTHNPNSFNGAAIPAPIDSEQQ